MTAAAEEFEIAEEEGLEFEARGRCVEALWSDAALSGFDDLVHYGGYAGLAVSHGVAHPMWIDTNGSREEEVYTARLEAHAFH